MFRSFFCLFLLCALLTGVTIGPTSASDLKSLMLAAEQGDAEAQFNLGIRYYTGGAGVPERHASAVYWIRLAAEQGFADAQIALGVLYAYGEGVPEDEAEAVHWFRLAAEQGNAYAQYNLGVAYFTGRGIPKDDIQAYAWVNVAVDEITENMSAKEKHKVRLFHGSIASELSSDGISRAKKLSTKYRNRIYGLGIDTVE